MAELAKELRLNERLSQLLTKAAKIEADKLYRKTPNIVDAAILLRYTSEAFAVERFVQTITGETVTARPDDR